MALLAVTSCCDWLYDPVVRAEWPRVRSLVPNTRPDCADGNNSHKIACVMHVTPTLRLSMKIASRNQ